MKFKSYYWDENSMAAGDNLTSIVLPFLAKDLVAVDTVVHAIPVPTANIFWPRMMFPRELLPFPVFPMIKILFIECPCFELIFCATTNTNIEIHAVNRQHYSLFLSIIIVNFSCWEPLFL